MATKTKQQRTTVPTVPPVEVEPPSPPAPSTAAVLAEVEQVAETATPPTPPAMAETAPSRLTPLQQITLLTAQLSDLREQALADAHVALRDALAALRTLGEDLEVRPRQAAPTPTIVHLPTPSKPSKPAPSPAKQGLRLSNGKLRATYDPSKTCKICQREGHDARAHRYNRNPFTTPQLRELGLLPPT